MSRSDRYGSDMALVAVAGMASFAALLLVARWSSLRAFRAGSTSAALPIVIVGVCCLVVAWLGSERLFQAGGGFVSADWLGPSVWALWGGCAGVFVGVVSVASKASSVADRTG